MTAARNLDSAPSRLERQHSGSPRYVDACEHDRWRVVLAPASGGAAIVLPYRCKSRRHEGPCATRWRRELFCRLRDGALAHADSRAVVFATWTLPAEHHRPHTELPRELWSDDDWRTEAARHEAATRQLTALVSEHFRELNQRRRRAGLPRLDYVWVAEAHRSGVPHAHAVVVAPELAAELRNERVQTDVPSCGAAYQAGQPCESWLAAAPAGVGRMDLSCARSAGAVTSYLSKLAGEVSKGQGSLTLGRHQRTYAASRGMLAPRRTSDGRWVGALATRRGQLVTRPRPGTRAHTIAVGLALVVRDGDLVAAQYTRGAEEPNYAGCTPTRERRRAHAPPEFTSHPGSRPDDTRGGSAHSKDKARRSFHTGPRVPFRVRTRMAAEAPSRAGRAETSRAGCVVLTV